MYNALALRALDVESELQVLGAPLVRLGSRSEVAITGQARPRTFAMSSDFVSRAEQSLAFGVVADLCYSTVEVGGLGVWTEDIGEEDVADAALDKSI